MAFIEPMHRNKPNITYLLTYLNMKTQLAKKPLSVAHWLVIIYHRKLWDYLFIHVLILNIFKP